jgi:hypothetical protein
LLSRLLLLYTILGAFGFSQVVFDEPRLSWVGVGEIRKVTITNTGDCGYYSQPAGWPGYDGNMVSNFSSPDGQTFEYPAGSSMHYIFDSGPWFGGFTGGMDSSARVAVGADASYNDLAVVASIYQSDQVLPGTQIRKYVLVSDLTNIPGQEIWPYTDLSINERRQTPNFLQTGQFVSDQDSYTVYGDFMPENEAVFFFNEGFDEEPLGVQVEQRTYSFFNEKIIYVEFLVFNKNIVPILDFYFSYFSDFDIGHFANDKLGVNRSLNLGFGFDPDFEDDGFPGTLGYAGIVLLDSPNSLTGFLTMNPDNVDCDCEPTDDGRYSNMRETVFSTFDFPSDVRMLMSSGPVDTFATGDSLKYAIALIAADDSLELYSVAERAQNIYNDGYLTPQPRPQSIAISTTNPKLNETITLQTQIVSSIDALPDSVVLFLESPYKPMIMTDNNNGWFSSEIELNHIQQLELTIGVFYEGTQTLYPGLFPPIQIDSGIPQKIRLLRNYQNPFNTSTTIEFTIDRPDEVKLSIFNAVGQKVYAIDDHFENGLNTFKFNAQKLASGVYFYQLRSGGKVESRRMMLIK